VLILEAKNHICTKKRMNYINYESKIIEELGVALIGWPGGGKVENPSYLSPDKGLALKNALEKRECRWIVLTSEQLESRRCQNVQCEQDGETIYGPARKKRTKRSECENDGVEEDLPVHDTSMACQ
jgi:hypothetical protein